jgi:hypothetical protein
MKIMFWALLLGNVIFFAAMQWGSMLFGDDQTVQVQPPLREGSILLLNTPQSKPVLAQSAPAQIVISDTASTPVHIAIPVAASTPVHIATSDAASAPVITKPVNSVCMEWGDFSGTDFERASMALASLQLESKLSQRQIEHTIGYWVYIPPLKDKILTNQKIVQLKARGVKEYFVVQDAGPWLNAISLGVFKTQEAAQNFLNELHAKDVRSAHIGERASKLKATVFVLNELDDATVGKLAALQKDFAGSELKNISCANNSH